MGAELLPQWGEDKGLQVEHLGGAPPLGGAKRRGGGDGGGGFGLRAGGASLTSALKMQSSFGCVECCRLVLPQGIILIGD